MRKRLWFILLLIPIFTLISCNSKDVVSGKVPIIIGESTLTFSQFTNEPNWKTFISASDEEDGNILITDDMVDASDVDFSIVGTYQVLYSVTDLDGNTVTHTINVNVISKTYTFDMNGEEEMTVEVYDTFIDPLVIAKDLNQNSIDFYIAGSVDTSIIGEYVLTYSIEGYTETLTRTVYVADTTAPIILTEEIEIPNNAMMIDWEQFNFSIEDNYSAIFDIEVLEETINYGNEGTYIITIQVKDEFNNISTKTIDVYVQCGYANGLYDLSKLSAEEKTDILIEMERYLLENVIGGVPLFRYGSFIMFSDRVEVFNELYNGVLEFGSDFSMLNLDDSNVLFDENTYGETSEYTFRDAILYNMDTFNPYESDESYEEEVIKKFTGALYDFYFDESLTGFELNPTLAAIDPMPVDPIFIDGKIYATTWQIPVRDDLTWTYHPNTDTSLFSSDHEILDANDYLWTWKLALDEHWFRAISGGNDFISNGVLNAMEYINGEITDFSQVGLSLAQDNLNTLEIQFEESKSLFDIKYMFSGMNLSPINQDLYESVGALNYGSSPETVASSGVYVLNEYSEDNYIRYFKNEDFPLADLYHYTGYLYRIISVYEDIFNAFLDGYLDVSYVPNDSVKEHIDDSNIFSSPDSTVFRLMINGFQTVENRDAFINQNPEMNIDDTWVPEPILGYLEMKQALYYGVDRYELGVNLIGKYIPAFSYFSSSYFVDRESGVSLYGTDLGRQMLEEFGGTTYGYLPNEAQRLFKEAVSKAIADGYYTAGTEDNPTIIDLEFVYVSSNNESYIAYVQALKSQYESILYDDVNHVGINLILNDQVFPTGYKDYLQTGKMDLGLGGIFTYSTIGRLYEDTNSTGFLMNFGIDTHTANIKIQYEGEEGGPISEIWSYNALLSALEQKTFIRDGVIQTYWDSDTDLIESYLDKEEDSILSTEEGNFIAATILGEDLEDIAVLEGYDDLNAFIVHTENSQVVLYMISVKDNQYKLYKEVKIGLTALEAIQNHIDYQYPPGPFYINVDAISGPLTDTEIESNAYILSHYAYTTINEIAAIYDIPSEFTEVYATSITRMENSWEDAYVVMHIGDYYIGVFWL